MPIARGYAEAAERGSPLHYGFSASWCSARGQVLAGLEPTPSIATGWRSSATRGGSARPHPRARPVARAAALASWRPARSASACSSATRRAPIRTSSSPSPGLPPKPESRRTRTCASWSRPTRRRRSTGRPSPLVAAETGAQMHHCHVNSTSRRHVDRVLATLGRRSRGLAGDRRGLPVRRGSTGIGAVFLAPERLAAWGLTRRRSCCCRAANGSPTRPACARSASSTRHGVHRRVPRRVGPGRSRVARPARSRFPMRSWRATPMPVFYPDGSTESRAWPLPPAVHPSAHGGHVREVAAAMVRETAPGPGRRRSGAARTCPRASSTIRSRRRGERAISMSAPTPTSSCSTPRRITDRATYLDSTRPSVGVRHLLRERHAGRPRRRDRGGRLPWRPLRGEPH